MQIAQIANSSWQQAWHILKSLFQAKHLKIILNIVIRDCQLKTMNIFQYFTQISSNCIIVKINIILF